MQKFLTTLFVKEAAIRSMGGGGSLVSRVVQININTYRGDGGKQQITLI